MLTLFKKSTTTCLRAMAIVGAALIASLSVISAAPSIAGYGVTGYGPGPGPQITVNSPNTLATTQANVFANTDVAPQVNVAPTIPIPYAEPYSVPVPVASAYPYPVPTAFKKRWHDDCCCDDDHCCDHGHDDCCCDWDDCCCDHWC
ncbi:hypothetical protein BGX29_000280 [Mortierella sp. GBA35]|nr:hypothetical protein BGX29_000280 [Mortierella sp. GBA35]